MSEKLRQFRMWVVGCLIGFGSGFLGMAMGSRLPLPAFQLAPFSSTAPITVDSGFVLGGAFFGLTTTFFLKDSWRRNERMRWILVSILGWTLGLICLNGLTASPPTINRITAIFVLAALGPIPGFTVGCVQLLGVSQITPNQRLWPIAAALASEIAIICFVLGITYVLTQVGL